MKKPGMSNQQENPSNQNNNPNDRSNIGSEAGLKDCSLLVNKDGDNKEDDSKNNTVDEFLFEEPPTLAHNQKCLEHHDELVIAYNRLTYEYLCARCISANKLQREHYQVYPSMINRTLEKLEAAKKMIKYRRTQLEQTAMYIRKKTKQNKE